jgi:hypothetical protein
MTMPAESGPEPTQQEIENAARRTAIADEQRAKYVKALKIVMGALGPDWLPRLYHYLVTHDDAHESRRSNGKVLMLDRAALVVYVAERSRDGARRYLTVGPNGRTAIHETEEDAYGPLRTESDPVRGFTDTKGVWHFYRRYECYTGFYEADYHPASAETLAKLRVSREANKVEREAEAMPLFAEQIRAGELAPKKRLNRRRRKT